MNLKCAKYASRSPCDVYAQLDSPSLLASPRHLAGPGGCRQDGCVLGHQRAQAPRAAGGGTVPGSQPPKYSGGYGGGGQEKALCQAVSHPNIVVEREGGERAAHGSTSSVKARVYVMGLRLLSATDCGYPAPRHCRQPLTDPRLARSASCRTASSRMPYCYVPYTLGTHTGHVHVRRGASGGNVPSGAGRQQARSGHNAAAGGCADGGRGVPIGSICFAPCT